MNGRQVSPWSLEKMLAGLARPISGASPGELNKVGERPRVGGPLRRAA